MAFKLVTDPDKLHALCQAGLLWWVSEEDGGKHGGISTLPVVTREGWTRELLFSSEADSQRPCFGILLEE